MAQISKILYIITQSELGGAQEYVQNLAKNSHLEGHEVMVCSGDDGELLHAMSQEGISVHIFRHLRREVHPWHDILCIWEMFLLMKKFRPDIAHLNSTKAGILGALSGKLAGVKKIFYTAHGYVFLEPLGAWKKYFYILAEKLSSYCKDKIICVSEFDKNEGVRHHIAQEKKFFTIHNGIDISETQFLPKEEAKKYFNNILNIPALNENKIIGTIANFYPTKGLAYFIEAAHILSQKNSDAIFIIIGDGSDRENLIKKIKLLGLEKKVFLLGKIPRASRYLRGFDVYVSSSVKEGFPYSLLEAMASATPIVSTNVGGIPEMLGGTGIMVAPKNPKLLAQAAEKLLSEKIFSENLSSRALERVQKLFTKQQMLKKTAELYFSRD